MNLLRCRCATILGTLQPYKKLSDSSNHIRIRDRDSFANLHHRQVMQLSIL